MIFQCTIMGMIRNSITQPVMIPSGVQPLRFQGCGNVVVTPHTDIVMLETDNADYMVKVPGHTFSDGDEVDFEITGEAVYLSKKTERVAGFTVNVMPKDELILQDNSDVGLLLKTLRSFLSVINSGEELSSLPVDFLKQIAVGIKGTINENQQEQLDIIIGMIIKNEHLDLPEIAKRLRSLIAEFGTDASHKTPLLTNMRRLVTFPELMIAEGIYRFQEIASVKEFLGDPGNGGWENFLREQFARDGCVWLRIADSGNKFPGVFQVSTAALKNELISMITSVSSNILRQIPVETFMDFIIPNNGIDKKMLHLLSSQMATVSGSPVMPDRSSSQGWLQWLQTIKELGDYSENLALRQPVRSTDLFRGMLEIGEAHGVLQGISLNDIGIIPGTGKTPISLIENAIDGIGLTFENKLSKGIVPSGSLKTELYRLLDDTHSTEQSPPSSELQKNNNETVGAFDIKGSLGAFQTFLSQEVSRLRESNFPQNELLLKNLLRVGDVIDQVTNIPESLAEKALFSGISSEMRERFTILANSIETLIQPGNSTEPAWLQLLKDVSSVLPMLKHICSTIPALHSLNAQLEDIVVELKTFLSHVSADWSDSAVKDLADVQKVFESKTFFEKTAPGDATAAECGNSIPRKVVEQLINRIESLQLLARQVATPEGSSQILELPVKIGNEWTDVTLQIIKKEARKKDGVNAQKHFSIYLDTVPSRLGGIHAVLDYEKGKNLSVTMEFEQKEVASWFKGNQENIRRCLQENNIHFVSVHFKTRMDSDVNRAAEMPADRSTNFDIKA